MKLSAEEIASGKLSPETLTDAVIQIKLNGYVLFEEVLPAGLVDEMNEAFLKLLDEKLKSDPEATEMNTTVFRKNRVRMDLPFAEPFIDPRVIANPFALPIIEQLIGKDCRSFYLSVDAPMPGSDYQAVHGDYVPFYPDLDLAIPITGLVVNFPLVDVTDENGPMEAWPGGTHLTPENLFTMEHLKTASERLTPVRMTMPKGSMLIRDIRMWHRGTPNRSDRIRPNMALIYGRSWWDGAFYGQTSLGITKETFAKLPKRAQQLYRFEELLD